MEFGLSESLILCEMVDQKGAHYLGKLNVHADVRDKKLNSMRRLRLSVC